MRCSPRCPPRVHSCSEGVGVVWPACGAGAVEGGEPRPHPHPCWRQGRGRGPCGCAGHLLPLCPEASGVWVNSAGCQGCRDPASRTPGACPEYQSHPGHLSSRGPIPIRAMLLLRCLLLRTKNVCEVGICCGLCPRFALTGSVTSCPGFLRKTNAPRRGTVNAPQLGFVRSEPPTPTWRHSESMRARAQGPGGPWSNPSSAPCGWPRSVSLWALTFLPVTWLLQALDPRLQPLGLREGRSNIQPGGRTEGGRTLQTPGTVTQMPLQGLRPKKPKPGFTQNHL